jgi:hypothetical protein
MQVNRIGRPASAGLVQIGRAQPQTYVSTEHNRGVIVAGAIRIAEAVAEFY